MPLQRVGAFAIILMRTNVCFWEEGTKEDNMRFEQSFEMLINHAMDNDK